MMHSFPHLAVSPAPSLAAPDYLFLLKKRNGEKLNYGFDKLTMQSGLP
jgi:hypothetical protein